MDLNFLKKLRQPKTADIKASNDHVLPKKTKFSKLFSFGRMLKKKKKIVIFAAIVVILAGGSVLAVHYIKNNKKAVSVTSRDIE